MLLSFWNPRGKSNDAFLEVIERTFPNKLLATKVRRDITVSEASVMGKPLFDVTPKSRAAEDFRDLTKELLKRLLKNVNALISVRLKKESPTQKMVAMAERSAGGNLSSFSGLFSPAELSKEEKSKLVDLLNAYAKGEEDVESDLYSLARITSEVKAINNQAAMLHGERIKRAPNDPLLLPRRGLYGLAHGDLWQPANPL